MKSKKSTNDPSLDKIKYPANEDIYRKATKLDDVDPDDVTRKKTKNNPEPDEKNELDFRNDVSGGDLDIPGAELDDEDELIGEEDEENNYYSLGGDEHNDLEEDRAGE